MNKHPIPSEFSGLLGGEDGEHSSGITRTKKEGARVMENYALKYRYEYTETSSH